MKKLLVTLAAVLVSVSTFAQGSVIFNNRVAGQVDAPVFRPGSTTAGAGPTVNAQLYLVTGGNVYTAITPATTFNNASVNALLTRYVVSPGTVTVNGVLPGNQATLVLRAWEGASYDAAVALYNANDPAGVWGQSNPITITLGGQPAGGGTPIQDPVLTGLQGFTLQQVPEPSTIALGVLGAAALLYRRRK